MTSVATDLGRTHMSSWFAGPRPSHAADPKVKENTKKENAKKGKRPFFFQEGGRRRPRIGEGGRGGDLVGGGRWVPARRWRVPIGCVPKPFRMLRRSLCGYVYEMYVNLFTALCSQRPLT